ncbi:MAG: Tol biopolymer transport system component [Marivirga sp.]|jgi:Tol biopolymer transport system component
MKKPLLLLMMCLGVYSALFSQSQDKVFYSSFRPQGWDIHLSKDEGKTFSAFTVHESLDYDAKISPDGQWVVFTSERNGLPHLFVKNIAGDTLPRLLVSSNSMQDQVDFSPDGQWIAFMSTQNGNAEIYKLPFSPTDTLDISQAQNLTNDDGGDFRPKFSNDGTTIAFSSDRGHETKPHAFFVFAMQRTGDIYSMSAEGDNAKRLTDSEGWDGSPVWSNNDSEIYFYSDRNGLSRLFKMTAQGENQHVISPDNLSCFSPVITSENTLLFTQMNEENKAFSILGLNIETQIIDSTFMHDFDMFNVDYHASGLITFHGGNKPVDTDNNKAGFEGDLLVKNSPETALLPDRSVDLFGVRRAFAAPPSIEGGQIVYDFLDAQGPKDLLTPYVYPLALLPLLAIIWFVIGIVASIKKRKDIPFWKYLIFSVTSIALAAGTGMALFNKFIQLTSPINELRLFVFFIVGVLFLLTLATWVLYKKRKADNNKIATLWRHYYLMFSINALLLVYLAIFCVSFFDVRPDFYSVNYTTNEVTHLFQFEADPNFNPLLKRIIDTKFTPDGQYIQFSVGGFRANPSAQGAVYRYHIKDEILERVTDLDSNNGFADFSKDNASMVFRSGRTGTMDIYIKENGKLTNLTNSVARENFPAISYDGNKIAFCSDVTGIDKKGIVKTMDIFTSNRLADNTWSEPKQITTYVGQEGHPHFSPDGEWLIFTTEEFGINDEQPLVQPYIFSPQMYGEITAIRLEDGKKVRLTHNKWEDGAPLWITTN